MTPHTVLDHTDNKMSRFSLGSNNGNGISLLTPSAIPKGDEYDSDSANFAPM